MNLVRMIAICLWTLLVVWTAGADAAEQRCNELGANCVCSEPLNTNNLVRIEPSWYNPADSTTKECLAEFQPGYAIARNSNDLTATNAASILGALPAGHRVNFVVRGPEGHTGIWDTGHGNAGSQFVKRMAARFYVYHSSNYAFDQEGITACTNSKLGELGADFHLDKMNGAIAVYNFLKWNIGLDCCPNGPGPAKTNAATWRDKWVRIEIVATNRAGGLPPNGYDLKVYLKDITNNTPEVTVVDLGQICPGCNFGVNWIPVTNLTPPSRNDKFLVNQHRAGSCAGFSALSHYMLAGWDTNQGQRIGAAYEIEGGGGGGDATPPVPPTNLLVQ